MTPAVSSSAGPSTTRRGWRRSWRSAPTASARTTRASSPSSVARSQPRRPDHAPVLEVVPLLLAELGRGRIGVYPLAHDPVPVAPRAQLREDGDDACLHPPSHQLL